MATRVIAEVGDPILRKHCKEVKKFDHRLRVLAEDMVETMDKADGVGLAAPQVSVLKRIYVARPYLDDQEKYLVMVNPEIYEREGEQTSLEGCLSVPGYIGHVSRPEKIKMRAQDLDGEWHEYEFEDFAAVVNCHEYEHLDGVIYTDKAEEVMTNEEYERALEEEREREKEADNLK